MPGGPDCVLTVGLPLALSRVIHGPLLGSGLVFRTLPSFLPAGVGASVGCSALRPAAACALFPGVPLSPLCTLGRRSASRFTLPTLSPVCSLPFRLGAFSFGCGFRLRRSVLLTPWGCRCACCSLPEAASQREYLPFCLVLPLQGSVHFSHVYSSVGGHVGVAHSFLPSLLLGGSLVRFCGGLC